MARTHVKALRIGAVCSMLAIALLLAPSQASALDDDAVALTSAPEAASDSGSEGGGASPDSIIVRMVVSLVDGIGQEISNGSGTVESDGDTAVRSDGGPAAKSSASEQAGSAKEPDAKDAISEKPGDEPLESVPVDDEGDGADTGGQRVPSSGSVMSMQAIEDEADESEDAPSGASSVSAQASSEDDGNASSAGASSAGAQEASSASASSTATKPTVTAQHALAWANTADEAKQWFDDANAVLQNGTAEVVSVKLPDSDGGETLTKEQLAAKSESDKAYYLEGVLSAPAGSKVTMTIMPARGYQLLSKTINDGAITLTAIDDDEKVGQYTFDMPSSGSALDCGFTKASDEVLVSDTKAITAGTISGADAAITSGTLELDIQDEEDDDVKKAFDSKVSSPGAIVAYLDTTLSNIVNQGSKDDTWDTLLDSTQSAITLNLTLSDSAAAGASQFYIVREADGQYQQAPVTYDSASKTISFKTNKYSSYAIVKGAPGTASGSNSASTATTTPQTGDGGKAVPPAVSALVSACVAVLAFRKMRSL